MHGVIGIDILPIVKKMLNDSTVNGDDNHIKNENKYDIFSVDLSEDREGKCATCKSLGFEVFEIIIITCLAIIAI